MNKNLSRLQEKSYLFIKSLIKKLESIDMKTFFLTFE